MWTNTVMAFGVLSVPVVFFLLVERTLVPWSTILRWFVLFALAGNLWPAGWGRRQLHMDAGDWLWFNLLAIGPALFGAGLWINYAFHGPEQMILVSGGRDINLVHHFREHGELPAHLPWPARSRDEGAEWTAEDGFVMLQTKPGDAAFGLAKGALGMWVLTSYVEVLDGHAGPFNGD